MSIHTQLKILKISRKDYEEFFIGLGHEQRTPNEGINQRYLKNWADVADKICFGCT